jgi:hypothetical protein
MNFAAEPRRVPCAGTEAVLTTAGDPVLIDGYVQLDAMSGALIT